MKSSHLICDLFGKERKLNANLIIKISNKVNSIVIKIFVEQTFFKQTSFCNQEIPFATCSRAEDYFGQRCANFHEKQKALLKIFF